MAALNYPDKPWSDGDTFTDNGVEYTYVDDGVNPGYWQGISGSTSGYVLPIASTSVLGGIKVGNNLTIEADGKLNAAAGAAGTLQEVTDAGNATTNDIVINDKITLYADGRGVFGNDSDILLKADGNAIFGGEDGDINASNKDVCFLGNGAYASNRSDANSGAFSARQDGTLTFLVSADGKTMIGGSLAGNTPSPNITLNADGTAAFAGTVDGVNPQLGPHLTTKSYVDAAIAAGGGSGGGAADLQAVTDLGSTTTNGASFGGTVKVTSTAEGVESYQGFFSRSTYDNIPSTTQTGSVLFPSQLLISSNASTPGSHAVFKSFLTTDTEEKIRMSADGSAEFKGSVNVNQDPDSGPYTFLKPAGGVDVIGSGDYAFRSRTSNTQNPPSVLINHDGSASFGEGNITLNADGSSLFDGPLQIQEDSSPWISVGYGTAGSANHRIQWDSAGLLINADPDDDVANSRISFSVDGTTRAQVDADSFKVGGSLPNTPNIEMHRQGWAKFGNPNADPDIDILEIRSSIQSLKLGGSKPSGTTSNSIISTNASSSQHNLVLQNANGNGANYGAITFETGDGTPVERLRITKAGNVLMGGTLPDSPNILLNGDGSAQFAVGDTSGVTFSDDGTVVTNGTTVPGFRINKDAIFGYAGGAAPNQTVQIANDGSATFNDTVTSGSSTRRGQFRGECPSSVTASSADVFHARYDNNMVAAIRYDGTAEFVGSVQSPRLALKPAGDSDAFIQAINQTTNKIVANHFGSGDIALSDDLTVATKIALNGSDGSAEFAAGAINIENNGANKGSIYVRQDTPSFDAYAVYSGGDAAGNKTVQIFGDGSATFNGKVTVSNLDIDALTSLP